MYGPWSLLHTWQVHTDICRQQQVGMYLNTEYVGALVLNFEADGAVPDTSV